MLLALVVPSISLGVVISREIGQLYQLLSQRSAAEGGWNPYAMHAVEGLVAWAGKWVDFETIDIRGNLLRWLEQASRVLFSWSTHILSNIVSFLAAAIVTFFTLFFLFREGGAMRAALMRLMPLRTEQVERLFSGIGASIIANVYGCVAVGLAQGFLTSLAFWVLGVPSPVLWGLVTAMFSLIPIIGSAAVWGPAAMILLVSGHWIKAVDPARMGRCHSRADRHRGAAQRDQRKSKVAHFARLLCSTRRSACFRSDGTVYRPRASFNHPCAAPNVAGRRYPDSGKLIAAVLLGSNVISIQAGVL